MANSDSNSYEEARKQRLQDNLRRFEDLGISNISKSLTKVANLENSPRRSIKPKSKTSFEILELRRSSRARNSIPSYRDEVVLEARYIRRSYGRRPSGSGKAASYEERMYALDKAEKLQSNLKSGHPSFVKSMVRSHVSSCFWLGLPSKFCKEHLPSNELKLVLEDEDGLEYDAIYIGSRAGLSGGWRGFAMDRKLDDGDALVFELTEPARFKIYIVKGSEHLKEEDNGEKLINPKVNCTNKSIKTPEPVEDGNGSVLRKLQLEIESKKRAERAAKRTKQ